jgi:DNA-binding NarL/FixJ family response regulator
MRVIAAKLASALWAADSHGDRRVRVLIADDQSTVRESLKAILQLEEDLEIVGFASNGWEAVRLAQSLSPDVILMDVSMPHLDGIEAAQMIRMQGIPTAIIALVVANDPASRQKALSAGVGAFIDKSDIQVDLVEVIRSAYTDQGRGQVEPSQQ